MSTRHQELSRFDVVRRRAGTTALQARRLAASGLAGAAGAIEPKKPQQARRPRWLRAVLVPVITGVLAAIMLVRNRVGRQADEAIVSEQEGRPVQTGAPTGVSTGAGTAANSAQRAMP